MAAAAPGAPVAPSEGQRLLTVQCDFDNTITVGNVSEAVLEAFASHEWKQVEADFAASRISVEESNRRQFPLVRANEGEIAAFVRRAVEVRPGIPEFVGYCRGVGIEVVVVSSGVDIYIEPILEMLGIADLELRSGRARVVDHGIVVDYADPEGAPLDDGFKLAWLERLKGQGRPIVYIGDGDPDIEAALRADHVIARDELARHFRDRSLPHFTFDTFHDVRRIVEREIVGRGGR